MSNVHTDHPHNDACKETDSHDYDKADVEISDEDKCIDAQGKNDDSDCYYSSDESEQYDDDSDVCNDDDNDDSPDGRVDCYDEQIDSDHGNNSGQLKQFVESAQSQSPLQSHKERANPLTSSTCIDNFKAMAEKCVQKLYDFRDKNRHGIVFRTSELMDQQGSAEICSRIIAGTPRPIQILFGRGPVNFEDFINLARYEQCKCDYKTVGCYAIIGDPYRPENRHAHRALYVGQSVSITGMKTRADAHLRPSYRRLNRKYLYDLLDHSEPRRRPISLALFKTDRVHPTFIHFMEGFWTSFLGTQRTVRRYIGMLPSTFQYPAPFTEEFFTANRTNPMQEGIFQMMDDSLENYREQQKISYMHSHTCHHCKAEKSSDWRFIDDATGYQCGACTSYLYTYGRERSLHLEVDRMNRIHYEEQLRYDGQKCSNFTCNHIFNRSEGEGARQLIASTRIGVSEDFSEGPICRLCKYYCKKNSYLPDRRRVKPYFPRGETCINPNCSHIRLRHYVFNANIETTDQYTEGWCCDSCKKWYDAHLNADGFGILPDPKLHLPSRCQNPTCYNPRIIRSHRPCPICQGYVCDPCMQWRNRHGSLPDRRYIRFGAITVANIDAVRRACSRMKIFATSSTTKSSATKTITTGGLITDDTSTMSSPDNVSERQGSMEQSMSPSSGSPSMVEAKNESNSEDTMSSANSATTISIDVVSPEVSISEASITDATNMKSHAANSHIDSASVIPKPVTVIPTAGTSTMKPRTTKAPAVKKRKPRKGISAQDSFSAKRMREWLSKAKTTEPEFAEKSSTTGSTIIAPGTAEGSTSEVSTISGNTIETQEPSDIIFTDA